MQETFKVLSSGDLVISGKVHYFTPKKESQYGKYELNLSDLPQEALDYLRERKYVIKNMPESEYRADWGDFITPKTVYPIKVLDAQKDEITDPLQSYGNGTEVVVLLKRKAKPAQYIKDGPDFMLYPSIVQVINLVEFETKSTFDSHEDGFTSSPGATATQTATASQAPVKAELDDDLPF